MIYINTFLLLCILLTTVSQNENKFVSCYTVGLNAHYCTFKGGVHSLAEVQGIYWLRCRVQLSAIRSQKTNWATYLPYFLPK